MPVFKPTFSRVMDRMLGSNVVRPLAVKIWCMQARKAQDYGFFDAKHIFIIGCGHSGTSIMLSLLDNHSKVSAIRGESRFFQLDPIRRAYLLGKWLEEWRPGEVLAEKTPVHIRYLQRMRPIFPNSKIIGITRHPLDVVASLYSRMGGRLDGGIKRWKRDNEILLKEHDNKTVNLVVKYEDLVVFPEETLVRIQRACALPVEHGLSVSKGKKRNWYARERVATTMRNGEESHADRRQRQINEAIFDGRGRYKEVLTEAQVRYVKERTSGLAVELGYNVDSIDN